ncbi:MAG: histidine phosphatase family protein [Proteobacteria bacterium]|nr:histidine phosphatase family protein [Pseudomonadota bacterium]
MKFILSVFIFTTLLSTAAISSQTILLLRHAEKMSDVKDPPLTESGHNRANCMAGWLVKQPFSKDIKVIYSSNYRRTLETAAPLATHLGVSIRLYDPRKLQGIAEELTTSGESAVIVGHSNTTPMLAGILSEQEITQMEETDYNSFWQVDSAEVTRLDQRLIGCEY